MSDIFREVDEEVRQDQAVALWNKYQNLIIAIALVVVAATGGYRLYDHFRVKAAEEAGAKFEAAAILARDGKSAEATAAWNALAKDAPQGYALLARLRAAGEVGQNDAKAGAAAFDAIANDAAVSQLFRDVAKIRAAMLVVDSAAPAEIEARLKPMAETGQPMRNLARELLGVAALKRNDMEAAARWFDLIVIDAQTGADARARAEAFLGLVSASRATPAPKPENKQ
mgnify:CR=1 FL=1